jgi:alanine-synthesizing transaminase
MVDKHPLMGSASPGGIDGSLFDFQRMKRLPPYVFSVVDSMKIEARRRGEDIVDLGMGNPDQGAPQHVVDKLAEAVYNPRTHRYSVSRGIFKLREAITEWYKRRYGVVLDPDTEAVVTIGAKEGLSHLALATIGHGDVVLVPNPTYPIHMYAVVIAGGDVRSVPIGAGRDFFEELFKAVKDTWPRPKMMILSFPHNPTTHVVDRAFFERIVGFAVEHRILVVHDLAYADLCFDGYKAPSLLEVPEARSIGVELFSMSKSYNMAGWRVGFVVGNRHMISSLARLKSYFDYGIFAPIQVAAIVALNGPQGCVEETVERYRARRDALVEGLARAGWYIEKPKGTMFVWAKIPEPFAGMGSVEFCKKLLREAKVAVSPGVGFGEYGEGYVRFALVENELRIQQAVRGIRSIL